MEQNYAFLKNNRVMQVAVFASQDEELADRIAHEQGFDDAVWVGETAPVLYSTYNGTLFIDPTIDELYEIGISPTTAAQNAAAEAEKIAAETAKAEAKQQALAALGLSQEVVNLLAE
jgi:hypothetical protein